MYKKYDDRKEILIGFGGPEEEWKTLNWNGILVPRYSISNYGRLYDNKMNRPVCFTLDKDGYFMASIHIEGIGYKKIRVHRFEKMTFDPEGYNEMLKKVANPVVNHKDEIKQNLDLNNLDWTDCMYNTQYSWDTGTNQNYGIRNGNGKYTEEEIHTFCGMIDQGLTNPQICDALGITYTKERMRISASLHDIREGSSHRIISTQYNFMKDVDVHIRYSPMMAHLVCNFLSDHDKDYSYKDIMDLLQIPNEERIQFRVFINYLYEGKTYKDIARNYNLKRPKEGNEAFSYLMS